MCQYCEYQNYLDVLEDMINDPDYEFAEDTLQGIYEWVQDKEHITEYQIHAIENIMNAVERRREG